MTKPDPTNAARQARHRAKRVAQGITEVRGIIAPLELHAAIKAAAKEVIRAAELHKAKTDV